MQNPDLKRFGFLWAGDLLRIHGETIVFVAASTIPQSEPERVGWRASEHRTTLKLGPYRETREEAMLDAEAWVANQNSILIKTLHDVDFWCQKYEELLAEKSAPFPVGFPTDIVPVGPNPLDDLIEARAQ